MTKTIGIARKKPCQEPELLEKVRITRESGLDGDGRGNSEKRQVTVLSEEQWAEVCAELGVDLPWQTRRANLLMRNVRFGPDSVGKVFSIEGGVALEITGETTPCERMDDVHNGLKKALSTDWRGGVTCRVITSGNLEVGCWVYLVRGVSTGVVSY